MALSDGENKPTWAYKQTTGALFHHHAFVARGYSGHEWGRNNPGAEAVPGIGPIPAGAWQLVSVTNSPNTGPWTIILHALDPTPSNDTDDRTGRSGFRIHGDSIAHPGQASHGCIILPRSVRLTMWQSGDHALEVVP